MKYRNFAHWLYRLHEALTKCGRLFTKRSKLTKQQAQHQTGKYARGFTMESVYWSHRGENLVKFIHETKDKYKNKISLKANTKCIITHPVCLT